MGIFLVLVIALSNGDNCSPCQSDPLELRGAEYELLLVEQRLGPVAELLPPAFIELLGHHFDDYQRVSFNVSALLPKPRAEPRAYFVTPPNTSVSSAWTNSKIASGTGSPPGY